MGGTLEVIDSASERLVGESGERREASLGLENGSIGGVQHEEVPLLHDHKNVPFQ